MTLPTDRLVSDSEFTTIPPCEELPDGGEGNESNIEAGDISYKGDSREQGVFTHIAFTGITGVINGRY